ncbi:MAG: pre-peptidase C-terminal domain-containing protein [Anaerolineae bacterium]
MRCPHCGAEVKSDDLFCPDCGQRLTAERRVSVGIRRWPVVLAVLAVIVTVCVGGAFIIGLLLAGGPTASPESSPIPTWSPSPSLTPTTLPEPTAPSLWTAYSSEELGISLNYPGDWFAQEDLSQKQVVFAAEEEDLQVAEFLSGTSFAAVVDTTSEVGTDAPDVILDNVSGFLASTYQQLQFGEVLAPSIDGHDGTLMSVEGEFGRPGEPMRGWVAAVVAYEHAYVFAAAAPSETWLEYEPVFRTMLDSVRLSAPSTPEAVSSPTTPPTAAPTAPSPTTLPVEGADPQEPDDSIAEAAPITTDGQPQTHNLHIQGDEDYLCFEATAGNAYTIETQGLGGDIDPVMYLYDSEGQELAHNDDASFDTLAPRLVWVAPSSGRYCVMVEDLAGEATGIDANYSISVRDSAFAEGADQYEPDDSLSQSSLIASDGTRQKHTFHTSTDVDYVSFAAQEGVEYTIQTGSLQAGCDTIIYLYDEAGVELVYDDDSSSETYASLMVWTAPSTGVYYVGINDYRGRAGPAVSCEIWITAQ